MTTLESEARAGAPHSQHAAPRRTILHVIAPAAIGGAEEVVCTLAAGQVRAGSRVHVAAVLPTASHEHPFVKRVEQTAAEIHLLDLSARRYIRERRSLAELCRHVAPDVMHTHGYRTDVVDGPVAGEMGIAAVTTVHGFTGGNWKNSLYEWLQIRCFRRFDAVVAVSRPLVDLLARRGVPVDQLTCIPNAWEPSFDFLDRATAREQLGLCAQGRHIGWIGRLSREKGPDVFVESLAHLLDEQFTASVIGDGVERLALVELARHFGVDRRLRWLGVVANAAQMLRAFDALVLSSRTEGTPMVVLEAMAAGTPIIASRVGGVPDVITSAEALIVPPCEPVALARAIRSALNESNAAAARADSARDRLTSAFAVEPWVDRYGHVYETAIARAGAESRALGRP